MTKDKILKLVGARIRDARKAKGWSQEELAYHSSIDRSYVGGIERGQRNISVVLLFKLAASLQIQASSLLQDLEIE